MSQRPPTASGLRARVLLATQREPALARPAETRRRVLLIVLGFAFTAAIAVLSYARERAHDAALSASQRQATWHVVAVPGTISEHRPFEYVLLLELAWAAIALTAAWLGISRGPSMLGRSRVTKLLVALLTPLALVVAWFGVAHAELPGFDAVPPARVHVHCSLMSVAYALGPLVTFFAVRRGTDPLGARWGGAAIGAVAGACGAVAYAGFCECTSPLHIAIAHVVPVAVLALLGALAGEQVLGFRT